MLFGGFAAEVDGDPAVVRQLVRAAPPSLIMVANKAGVFPATLLSMIGSLGRTLGTFGIGRRGRGALPLTKARSMRRSTTPARAGTMMRVPVALERLAGSTAAPGLALGVPASFDDGRMWIALRVHRGVALISHPRQPRFVPLRLTAADSVGITVTQRFNGPTGSLTLSRVRGAGAAPGLPPPHRSAASEVRAVSLTQGGPPPQSA